MGIYIHFTASQLRQGRVMADSMNALQMSMNRLSNGVRTRASEGAASLAINERLNSELRGAQMELKNLGDKASLLQTLDGALYEATESLQKLRTLAVSASSAHLSMEDRLAMEEEFKQLTAHLDELSEQTTFNHKKLLNGDLTELSLDMIGDTRTPSSQEVTNSALQLPNFKAERLGQNANVETKARGAFLAPLNSGDITINGVQIRGTSGYDDQLSYSYASGSAIAKSKAINAASGLTGVTARVDSNVVRSVQSLQSFTLDQGRFLKINGLLISSDTVEANDASGALRQSINELSFQTGVSANIDELGRLVLSAEDGRNITLEYSDFELRQAIGIIDTAGDEVNFTSKIDPPIYTSDGDITKVEYVTNKDAPLQEPPGGYSGLFDVIENSFSGRADGVDFLLEVVKAGDLGVAQYRVKQEDVADGAHDLDESFEFGAYGGELSAPNSNKVRITDSEYLGASRLEISLKVTKAGSPASPVTEERPEVEVYARSLDDPTAATVLLGTATIDNGQTLDLSTLANPLPVTLSFPYDSTRYLLNSKGGGLSAHYGAVPYADKAPGDDNPYAPRMRGWSGIHTADFTLEVIRAGHANGQYHFTESDEQKAIVRLTADLTYQPNAPLITKDFLLNSYYQVNFLELDTSNDPSNLGGLSFDFPAPYYFSKASLIDKSLTGDYQASPRLFHNYYIGDELREYEVEFTTDGIISRSSGNGPNAEVRVYGFESGTRALVDTHQLTNLIAYNAYRMGQGVEFDGAQFDLYPGITSSLDSSNFSFNVSPALVNTDYYNGNQDKTVILKVKQAGFNAGSDQAVFTYYDSADPSTSLYEGVGSFDGLTMSDGLKFSVFNSNSSFTPLTGVPTSNGYVYINSNRFAEDEDMTFTSEVKLIDNQKKLVTTWSNGDEFTRTIIANNSNDIGHGVALMFGGYFTQNASMYKVGAKWTGSASRVFYNEGDELELSIKTNPVKAGDSYTMRYLPVDLAKGTKWEFTGVGPDWKPNDVFKVNLNTGFDPTARTLTDQINLPNAGEIKLSGAGSFEVGDQIRVSTRAFVGEVQASGAYTNSMFPTSYILTVTKAGEVDAGPSSAELSWVREDGLTDTENGGSGVITGFSEGSTIYLEEGVEVSFHDLGEGVYLAEGDQIEVIVGRNLEYSFGGQVSLHSDKSIDIQYADSALDQQLGRLTFTGSDEQALSPRFKELSLTQARISANQTSSLSNAGLLSMSQVRDALDTIDAAIAQVSEARTMAGAGLNRLEHQIGGLSEKAAGIMGVQERLVGVDVAQELVNFTAEQIKMMTAPMLFDFHLEDPRRALQLIQQGAQ